MTGIGLAYVAVIASWLIVEGKPSEPIADPYLAAMEVLTILSALALLGWLAALWCYVDNGNRASAVLTLTCGTLAAGITISVHFLQLTAVRQMWRRGVLADYRLVWPSFVFAIEYLAWDVLIGITMLCAAAAIGEGKTAGHRHSRRALVLAGLLCLTGSVGPVSGVMPLQNIAVFGYAIVLPVVGAFTARMFGART